MIWKSLLALGAKYDHEIEQLDIITAFLESKLKEAVYVEQPYGFEETKSSKYVCVCRLLRALYGMKQSPRGLYFTLINYLIFVGFQRLEKDHCVFIHETGIIIAIYVDHLLIQGPDINQINYLKEEFRRRFQMKNLGALFWYLGMEVTRDRANQTLYINQSMYTNRILANLGMDECKSTKVPMEPGLVLEKNTYGGKPYQASPAKIKGYQSLVGSLLWLACMRRPGISYSVRKCSR